MFSGNKQKLFTHALKGLISFLHEQSIALETDIFLKVICKSAGVKLKERSYQFYVNEFHSSLVFALSRLSKKDVERIQHTLASLAKANVSVSYDKKNQVHKFEVNLRYFHSIIEAFKLLFKQLNPYELAAYKKASENYPHIIDAKFAALRKMCATALHDVFLEELKHFDIFINQMLEIKAFVFKPMQNLGNGKVRFEFELDKTADEQQVLEKFEQYDAQVSHSFQRQFDIYDIDMTKLPKLIDDTRTFMNKLSEDELNAIRSKAIYTEFFPMQMLYKETFKFLTHFSAICRDSQNQEVIKVCARFFSTIKDHFLISVQLANPQTNVKEAVKAVASAIAQCIDESLAKFDELPKEFKDSEFLKYRRLLTVAIKTGMLFELPPTPVNHRNFLFSLPGSITQAIQSCTRKIGLTN